MKHNINAIAYIKDENELFVEFKSRAAFVYSDVSLDEYAALMASESIPKHFNQFIKAVKVWREVVTVENDQETMSDKD